MGPAGALVAILSSYSAVYGEQIVAWLAIGSGIISLGVWYLGWERYATVLPLSVLEGFSFAVGLVIGFSQLVNAFGLDKSTIPVHKVFYENVYEVLIRTGDLVWADFGVFLALFTSLMWLSKYLAGKPWIVLIAVIGVVYGLAMDKYGEDGNKPKLLRDLYQTLKTVEKSQLF